MHGHRAVLSLALAIALLPAHLPAQDATPLTDAQVEHFLLKARVVRTRSAAKGVTGSLRATLSDGTLTHDAHIQTIDEEKFEFRTRDTVEFNFRDSWRFNIATYRIDRLLGLQLVPVSVERSWNGKRGAFTWWVDDVLMDEGERLKRQLQAPDTDCWNEQVRLVRVLDQLIDNVDRNLGNMLITKTWRVWAIDHTRAFRASDTPRKPANLTRIDRTILARLKALDFDTLKRDVGDYLNNGDIRALLARRDGMVAKFENAGEVVLFDRGNPEAGCSGGS